MAVFWCSKIKNLVGTLRFSHGVKINSSLVFSILYKKVKYIFA